MSDSSAPQRIFKTGVTLITESPEMRSLSIGEVQGLLKQVYPELAHATTRETVQADNTVLVEFIPTAGTKG